jgi:hypothetical protein
MFVLKEWEGEEEKGGQRGRCETKDVGITEEGDKG